MRKWKRKISVLSLLLSLLLILVMALAGCGGKDSSSKSGSSSEAGSSKSSDAIKITIWVAGTGDPAYDESYRTIFDNYVSGHPNVSYELTYISWAEYFTKLNTGLIGGSGPDIFMLGYGQFGTVEAMDVLLPLNDYFPKDWDGYEDFHENMLKIGQKDNQQLAMFTPSTRVFFYRKDIMEQAGLTENDMQISSLDDLLALAEKMAVYDDNGLLLISGLEIDPDQEQTLFTFGSMFDTSLKLWNDDGTAAFNTPGVVQCFTKLQKEVIGKDYISLQDPSGIGNSGMLLGSAAMAILPENFYAIADAAFPGQIGIMKSDMNTLLIGNYLAVNKNSKKIEVAADFLIHMFSRESLKVFQDIASYYSGRKSLDDDYMSLNPEYAKVVYAYERSHPYSLELNAKYTAAVRELRLQLDSVFQGADVKESLDYAEKGWNEVINE